MEERVREQRLEGERVFSGRVVVLEVDRVALPGGGESVREVVRHRGAAVILPILPDGRVLLVRQFRYPVGESLLELPAGTLEPGESAELCARRELIEETGQEARSITSLGRFYSAPGYTDEVLHAVVATDLEPSDGGRPDDDERIEVETYRVDVVLAMIERGEIRDAKTISTMFLARLLNVV